MTNDRRIRVLVHLAAGTSLALVSVLADSLPGAKAGVGLLQALFLATGLVIIAIGFVLPAGAVSRVSTNVGLSAVSLIVCLLLSEGLFRAVGFDFAREEEAWRKIPLFFRIPTVPTGSVFFRRHGPEQWTGQVLNTRFKQLYAMATPYENEQVITVTYDMQGFRNPHGLLDWDVALAGDSFTELGHLPYEQLFTTALGTTLNAGVLNLGTSFTGPLTQLSYLQDYGVAASTRHAVVVFFEGNDLDDLGREYEAIVRWQETGQREYREFKKQPSVVRALGDLLVKRKGTPIEPLGAYFKSSLGELPVTLAYAPPGSSEIPAATMHQLNHFFANYARFGRERHIIVWLAYMPTKERVIHGQMRFPEGANPRFRDWQPSDLPQVINRLSEQHGVRFIDLTPALVEETRTKSQLLYNALYDTHLTSLGCQVVARELARHLDSASDRE